MLQATVLTRMQQPVHFMVIFVQAQLLAEDDRRLGRVHRSGTPSPNLLALVAGTGLYAPVSDGLTEMFGRLTACSHLFIELC